LRSVAEAPGDPAHTREVASGRRDLGAVKDEMVQILMDLTADIERFDAMVAVQQRAVAAGHTDQDRLTWRMNQLGEEAREMIARSGQALERLRRLSA
jgi:hypothetical protein